jgi:hypothetical protein
MLYLIIIVLLSLILFISIVKGMDYIPNKYYDNISVMEGIGIFFVLISTILGLYTNYKTNNEQKKKEYIENILTSFDKIDDYFINNYRKYKNIIKIFYQKIQLPSTNTNLRNVKMTMKEKDILFVMYNKITYDLEKMFLLDPELFENNNLGMRVRLYIDSIYYYEFWHITQNLFKIDFANFMNNKYDFLKYDNSIYNKPNTNMNRYSVVGDNNFIYNSPKYSTIW